MEISELQYLISRDDQKAFGQFYQLYYERVFRYTFYFLKNKEACGEVLTNVFFSIWKSRNRFKDVIDVEAYLYIVTKNEATRFLKQKKNNYLLLDEIPVQLEASGNNSPDEKLLIEEIEKILNRAIGELPEKCLHIFLLNRQEGLKPKQIAEILSISESTVRVQLKIAVDKISKSLKPYLHELLATISQ